MKKKLRQSLVLLLILTLTLIVTGCGEATNNTNQTSNSAVEEKLELLDSTQHPVVTMEMSNGGIVKIELYPEVAPQSVANFVNLIESGFYDGLIFHRVIPEFMIQGGDPQGTGMGGPGYTIKGEFTKNGFKNLLEHKRGVISMARSNDPNSAGSQFFIMVKDSPHLDGLYASFGEVIEGMDTVDAIVNQETKGETPVNPIYMSKVTVDTKGLTLAELETVQ